MLALGGVKVDAGKCGRATWEGEACAGRVVALRRELHAGLAVSLRVARWRCF